MSFEKGGTKVIEFAGLGELAWSALPPTLPLMTDTIHRLGLLLLTGLVAIPAAALVASAWQEARARRRSGGSATERTGGRLCSAHGTL
jgi:hypothetical protein